MFSGVIQGSLLYILDKSNLSLKVAEVESVGNPTPKYNQTPQYNVQPFAQPEMFVDIKVRIGEESIKFEQLPANQAVANKNNVVVSDNKDAMNIEVDAMMRTSRGIIESVPYHEKVLQACDVMLRELNPQFAKEKEHEEKIGALEEKMGDINDKLNQMFDLLSETVGHSRSKKSKEE